VIPNSYHIEAAKGTPQENRQYCSKDGNWEEQGDIPQQGKRRDLDQVRSWLKERIPVRRALEDASSLQSFQFYLKWKSHFPRQRESPPKVYWIYGASGIGKSRKADTMGTNRFWQDTSGRWFDGYDPDYHDTVVFDDLRPDTFPFNYLLRLLDRYPLQVQCKGGYIDWRCSNIVITTLKEPKSFVPEYERDQERQLLRRIHEVIKLE
jgi:hypothetical protein